MFINSKYGSPDSRQRKWDLSDCKFLPLLFDNARIGMAFRCAYQEKVSYDVQASSFSKEVGIPKAIREKGPSAVKWFAQGYTAGWVRPDS